MVTIGAVAVESAIALSAGPVVAAYVAPFLAGMVFATTSFCQNPPPAMPTMSAQDFLDLANIGNHAVQYAAMVKLQQWFTSQYWYQLCDCVNAATPAAPAPTPLPPLGTNIGLPSGGLQGPCWTTTQANQFPANSAPVQAPYPSFDWPGLLPGPVVGTTSVTNQGGTLTASYKAMPPGVTTIDSSWILDHLPTNANLAQGGYLQFFDATLAATSVLAVLYGYQATSVTGSATSPAPSPYPAFVAGVGWNTDNVIRSAQTTLTFNCGTPGLATPCCPPDPMTDQLLVGINAKLDQLLSLEAAETGGGAPAFTTGVTHTSLSGNGTLVFTGAPRALRVDVTSPTTSFIMNPGSPNYFFSMGFITSYAQTYPLKGWRLVYTGQVYPLVPQATEVGWTLPPGLVINITELL